MKLFFLPAKLSLKKYSFLKTSCPQAFRLLNSQEDCFSQARRGHRQTRDSRRDTRGRRKTSISCETSSNFVTFDMLSNRLECTKCHPCHAKRHDNLLGSLRKGYVLQLLPDTARPQENQRLETRHVGAEKRAFSARFPSILTLCIASKSTCSYEFS